MKNTLKTATVLFLTLAATTACTRRVQVESEPNRPEYRMQSNDASVSAVGGTASETR